MREILYKAQRADGKGWVFGNYCSRASGYVTEHCIQVVTKDKKGKIISVSIYEVIPETVCQYTGLKDKKGVKIFEGDTVSIAGKKAMTVYFENGCYYLPSSNSEGYRLANWRQDVIKVTGNIHDK